MKVIQGKFGATAPDDLAAFLRQAADDVDNGVITGMVFAAVRHNEYTLSFSTSLETSLVLSALLNNSAIQNLRRINNA